MINTNRRDVIFLAKQGGENCYHVETSVFNKTSDKMAGSGTVPIRIFNDVVSNVHVISPVYAPYVKLSVRFCISVRQNFHISFKVSSAVTMKNDVCWDVTLCDSFENRRFGGTYRLLHHSDGNLRAGNNVSNQST
jgi:hypothetical protein